MPLLRLIFSELQSTDHGPCWSTTSHAPRRPFRASPNRRRLRIISYLCLHDVKEELLPRPPTGGGDRTRTDDPLLAKQVLSRLSYTPSPRGAAGTGTPQGLVGLGRLELPTSRLSGVRSRQLSYRPRCTDPDPWAPLGERKNHGRDTKAAASHAMKAGPRLAARGGGRVPSLERR